MANFEEIGPRAPVVEAIRVDQVNPRARAVRRIVAFISLVVAMIML
jgi:hypothetical protein